MGQQTAAFAPQLSSLNSGSGFAKRPRESPTDLGHPGKSPASDCPGPSRETPRPDSECESVWPSSGRITPRSPDGQALYVKLPGPLLHRMTGAGSSISQAPGFECTGSYLTAEAALSAIPNPPPDVAMLDINLPSLDGIKCFRQLRIRCPKIQFLMLTVPDAPRPLHELRHPGVSRHCRLSLLAGRVTPRRVASAQDPSAPPSFCPGGGMDHLTY